MLEFQDGSLDKNEILTFIKESLKKGRFTSLFEAQNQELKKLVDELFETLFEDLFLEAKVERKENFIDSMQY